MWDLASLVRCIRRSKYLEKSSTRSYHNFVLLLCLNWTTVCHVTECSKKEDWHAEINDHPDFQFSLHHKLEFVKLFLKLLTVFLLWGCGFIPVFICFKIVNHTSIDRSLDIIDVLSSPVMDRRGISAWYTWREQKMYDILMENTIVSVCFKVWK